MKRPRKKYLEDQSWEEKAQENPLYAVMSVAEFADSGSSPTQKEIIKFYKEGNHKVDKWIHPWLVENQSEDDDLVLEFGCGMGRLLNALVKYKSSKFLHGVDISETMIKLAKKYLDQEITLQTINENGNFPYRDNYFDYVYSSAVFQHISSKSVVTKSIHEIGRVLKVGGRVKLNFNMVYPLYGINNSMKKSVYGFEKRYLLYGWDKRLGIPLWGLKLRNSNNWSGIRMGYNQLISEFRKAGISIYGICQEYPSKQVAWLYGVKL